MESGDASLYSAHQNMCVEKKLVSKDFKLKDLGRLGVLFWPVFLSFLIRLQVQARISGNPKRKHRDPWSWSPRREARALAELEMS